MKQRQKSMHSSTMIIDTTSFAIAFLVFILIVILSILRYKRSTQCKHKFVLLQEIKVMSEGASLPHARKYILQCEHCGNLKKETF